MEIKIKKGEELNSLLDALADELVYAHSYYRLQQNLVNAGAEYEREFCQSNTFWHLTTKSLRQATMSTLCRIYDQNATSLNLVNLLDTIKANQHLFAEPEFRKRLAGNAFVDVLARHDRIPKLAKLEKDIEVVSCRDPLVWKLMLWRNNIFAHRGSGVSLGKGKILDDNPLPAGDVETLLERANDIFNNYSSLYRASHQSTKIVMHEDFKYLLNFVRLGLQKWDEDIDKQQRALSGGPKIG